MPPPTTAETLPRLVQELYFRSDAARELFENEHLLTFFEAIARVNPQDHGTNFILSPGMTPDNPRLKELDENYTRTSRRRFPQRGDGTYDTDALAQSIELLVTVDGITEIDGIGCGDAALRRSALYWDGGVCETLDRMGVPNNRPLYQRYGFIKKVGTGTLGVITASRHLPGYTVRLHDNGSIHVFKDGLIVGSKHAEEIGASADAYEAAAPLRHARERADRASIHHFPSSPRRRPARHGPVLVPPPSLSEARQPYAASQTA